MLVIAGADHDGIQILIRQHLFGKLEQLGARAKQPLRVVCGAIAVHRPEIADAAQIEIGVGLSRELQHGSMARRPVAASNLADLNSLIGPHNAGVRTRRLRQ